MWEVVISSFMWTCSHHTMPERKSKLMKHHQDQLRTDMLTLSPLSMMLMPRWQMMVFIFDDILGNDRLHIMGMLTSYADILTDVFGSSDATRHVITLSDKNGQLWFISNQYRYTMRTQLRRSSCNFSIWVTLNMLILHTQLPYSWI